MHYAGDWWIAGGWAVQAFTNTARPHGDIDLSIPRSEVPALLRHLQGQLDVWAADKGALHPLLDAASVAPASCGNLWLRPDGTAAWEYDILLMDVIAGTWTYKRDSRVSLPMAEMLWEHDGIRYLRPEVQLLHKASSVRPKDQEDFDSCFPLLSRSARRWLREALAIAHPDHAWMPVLA